MVQGGVSNSLGEGEESTAGCGHLGRAQHYQFRHDLPDPLCLMCAILHRPVLRRATLIALIIGTILTIINQSDVLLMRAVTPLVLLKILLTYVVPYSVSTYSALSTYWIEEAK